MNNVYDVNSPTTQDTLKSQDLALDSESLVKKVSVLENVKLVTVSIQVEDEISRIDYKIQQPKDQTPTCLDIVEISIDEQDDIINTDVCKQDHEIDEKYFVSNVIKNNDHERTFLNETELIEHPGTLNSMTIHGYNTEFEDYDEDTNQQDNNACKSTKMTEHEPIARRLKSLLPPPAYPDPSEPLLCETGLQSRNDFIKCVLVMVLLMIVMTAMFTVYVLITPDVRLYFEKHGWEILLPAVLLLVLADCGMICSLCARSAPWNFIFSAMTVIPMSLLSAKISAFFNTEVVLYAIMSTGFVVFVCILLACSSFDFTNWIAFILIIAVTFAVLATFINVVAAITGQTMRPLHVIVLYASTMFQVIMFTIQLQMILGKNNALRIGVGDYCLAAFLLYTSILDIFLRRMSDTRGLVKVSKSANKLTNDEKEETIINIDKIPIADELAKHSVDSGKITEQHTKENNKNNNYSKAVTNALENEKQVNQKSTVVELVDKQRKSPDVWVQFQQDVKESPGKQIVVGRRSSTGGRNYQDQGGAYGGGGLDYSPESRNGFVMLVFTIVLVMLALTAIYVAFVLNSESATEFYITYRRPLIFLSMGVLIAMSYVVMCCLPLLRTVPCNYFALFIVLAAMSNLAAVGTTIITNNTIILFALLATSITVAVCILLALSQFDFTKWYLYVVVIGIVLMVLSIAVAIANIGFGIYFRPLMLALLYISTILQIIVLIMELQMILGGRSIEISEEDYVLAAYMLYTSIVNLFLQILQILNNMDID